MEERVAARLGAITLLTEGGFPSAELLGWFKGRSSWRSVMRLRANTWIQGTAAPMGCQVRRLRLPRGHCRGFRDVLLWAEGTQRVNLVRAYGLRDPQRIDRLLLVVAIAVLLGSLQGYAVSLAGERRRIDPHGAGPELWADQPEVAAAVRGQSLQILDGLGTHPPAYSGAMHPQPRRTATAERAMVHAD